MAVPYNIIFRIRVPLRDKYTLSKMYFYGKQISTVISTVTNIRLIIKRVEEFYIRELMTTKSKITIV